MYIITEFITGGDLRSKLKDTSVEMDWKLRVGTLHATRPPPQWGFLIDRYSVGVCVCAMRCRGAQGYCPGDELPPFQEHHAQGLEVTQPAGTHKDPERGLHCRFLIRFLFWLILIIF
jgi:hypothetical protein